MDPKASNLARLCPGKRLGAEGSGGSMRSFSRRSSQCSASMARKTLASSSCESRLGSLVFVGPSRG
eukprot:101365-Alexandrium_andersonii.AAC.1